MKGWASVVIVLVMPGGFLLGGVLLVRWLQQRRDARDAAILAAQITPPVPLAGCEKLAPADYDRVLREAERRRGRSDTKRSEARRIAAGDRVDPVIHLAGRR